MRTSLWLAALGLVNGLIALPAVAQDAAPPTRQSAPGGQVDAPQDAEPETRQATPGGQIEVKPAEEAATGFWQRANLFGDWGGLRTRLGDRGISFGLTEASEVFGNATGGVRQGAIYEGLTTFGIGIDTERLFGLKGGTFNATGYQIHGRGLSLNNLGNNLHTVSSIEALRGWLLFELWYEQKLFDGKLSIRAGQLAADQEFMISSFSGLFLNHTFGWSSHPSADLPSGGPSYPLGTPGVRVRYTPQPGLNLLLGVFNGDPAGPGPGFPQDRNPSGTAFRFNDGVFAIGEVQYTLDSEAHPGTYKLGGWYHSGRFADQGRNAAGMSLADPAATDLNGRRLYGNYGLYGVVDQLLIREAPGKDQGLGSFLRLMGSPGDRNLINFYADAGVTYKGAISGRPDDTAGLGVAVARYSDSVSTLDANTGFFTSTNYPIRRTETVLELTYQAQIAPWWQVQPTAQYIFNLGGGVPDPQRPGRRLNDAAVFGLRTNITF